MHVILGQQVMPDSDLTRLYGVETRVLNQAVKRNIERFPEDFMFQLNLNLNKGEPPNFINIKFAQSNLIVKFAVHIARSGPIWAEWAGVNTF